MVEKREKKGKKKHINKKTSEKWKKYKVVGEKLEKEKTCPRCGVGVFLAKHKNRIYCGKCHYTEFSSN